MEMLIPRPEYPRPQFVRSGWMNLNGLWQFEMDQGASGRDRGLIEKVHLDQQIVVPFCMESRLSGIGYTDFMNAVWYRRTFTLPEEARNRRVLLHFGAVDYKCEAWVNGQSVGVHEGGYASFTFEITQALQDGENTLVVCADDHILSGRQPTGKQSRQYHSVRCHYTRTTGIWQTVWLEWVNDSYIQSVKMIPDAANGTVYLDLTVDGAKPGMQVAVQASYQGRPQAEGRTLLDGNHGHLMLKMANRHLWEPGSPCLYDLHLTLLQGEEALDEADSYCALRTITFDGKCCLLNGKPVFQRLVLDQGFYPDGIYTAPNDEALKNDILLSMQMGFNGARLHQKVFEQRYLYWADQLGYLCWGEMPSWGIDPSRPHTMTIFLREWLQVIERDFNAPCIVGWCPYNEVWAYESGAGLRQLTLQMTYRTTKAADPTRPCIDASGGYHVETDVFDLHDYEQNVEAFAQHYQPGKPMYDKRSDQQTYDGKLPVFVSEYGGIRWTQDEKGWGYGEGPKTADEFLKRYEGLTTALLRNPEHMGFCYTQLTDVEQEQNGLYTYEREPKFDPELIARVNRQKAAMEE